MTYDETNLFSEIIKGPPNSVAVIRFGKRQFRGRVNDNLIHNEIETITCTESGKYDSVFAANEINFNGYIHYLVAVPSISSEGSSAPLGSEPLIATSFPFAVRERPLETSDTATLQRLSALQSLKREAA